MLATKSFSNAELERLLEPEQMIRLYSLGAFPMADKGRIDWYMPDIRTIIPLDEFNYPRSLRKFIEKSGFEFRYDHDYMSVIKGCADREETWISERLIQAYTGLYDIGHLHTVEVYKDNVLCGGLYGITAKGAFFGESMFSRVPQASKSALIKLIERLREKGFVLLDVQFMTEHLKMFGAVEIPMPKFERLLKKAQKQDVDFGE